MFSGRLRASGYWGGFFVLFCLYLMGGFLSLVLGFVGVKTVVDSATLGPGPAFLDAMGNVGLLFVVMGIITLFSLFFTIGMTVRRLHDLNLSGWFVLAPWVVGIVTTAFGRTGTPQAPVYATWAIILSVLTTLGWLFVLLYSGKIEQNKYGPCLRYRSWWAALTGSKVGAIILSPTGPEGLVQETTPTYSSNPPATPAT